MDEGERWNERKFESLFAFGPDLLGFLPWSVVAVTTFWLHTEGERRGQKFHACLNMKTQPFFLKVTFSSSLISFNLFSAFSTLGVLWLCVHGTRIELKFITLQ